MTPLGAILIATIVAGLALAGVGPPSLQVPGFLAATVAAVVVLGATVPSGGGRDAARAARERRDSERSRWRGWDPMARLDRERRGEGGEDD